MDLLSPRVQVQCPTVDISRYKREFSILHRHAWKNVFGSNFLLKIEINATFFMPSSALGPTWPTCAKIKFNMVFLLH